MGVQAFGVQVFLPTYLSASTQFVAFGQTRCMRGLNVSGTCVELLLLGRSGSLVSLYYLETNLRSSIILVKIKPTCSHGKGIIIRAQAEEKE